MTSRWVGGVGPGPLSGVDRCHFPPRLLPVRQVSGAVNDTNCDPPRSRAARGARTELLVRPVTPPHGTSPQRAVLQGNLDRP